MATSPVLHLFINIRNIWRPISDAISSCSNEDLLNSVNDTIAPNPSPNPRWKSHKNFYGDTLYQDMAASYINSIPSGSAYDRLRYNRSFSERLDTNNDYKTNSDEYLVGKVVRGVMGTYPAYSSMGNNIINYLSNFYICRNNDTVFKQNLSQEFRTINNYINYERSTYKYHFITNPVLTLNSIDITIPNLDFRQIRSNSNIDMSVGLTVNGTNIVLDSTIPKPNYLIGLRKKTPINIQDVNFPTDGTRYQVYETEPFIQKLESTQSQNTNNFLWYNSNNQLVVINDNDTIPTIMANIKYVEDGTDLKAIYSVFYPDFTGENSYIRIQDTDSPTKIFHNVDGKLSIRDLTIPSEGYCYSLRDCWTCNTQTNPYFGNYRPFDLNVPGIDFKLGDTIYTYQR